MLHYLPGCDVRKNHSEAVLKMQNYMEKKGAIIDECCRVKSEFLKKGDIIVNNCTLCQIVLNETHPNNECLSLYELVLKDNSFKWIDHHEEVIVLQDCWRTRDNLRLQIAIRECLKRMNYTIVELEENFDKTRYCGVWLNNLPAQDCLEVAPITFNNIIQNYTHSISKEEQIKMMVNRVAQYPTDKIVVYCNGCERGIKLGGGHPMHIIEILAEGLAEGL